jgi:hypothetical protein
MKELEEYAKKVAENMGFKDLCVKVKLNPNLKSDGKLSLKLHSGIGIILSEIEELLNKSLEDRVYFATVEELGSKIEDFSEKYKKLWKYLPHEIEIEINQNRKSVEEQKDIINHELGHYYILKKHSKISRILKILNTPEKLLRRVAYPLPEIVSGGMAFLTSFTSVAYVTGHLSPLLPLVFSSLTFYFSGSYVTEEILADYYGKKYRI